MNATSTKPTSKQDKKDNPFLNLSINLIIPTIIMMKFSNDRYLGSVNGLLIALALPFSYGIYDYIQKRKTNFFSLIGLLNIAMTGGIGLFELDKNLMILKETAIPLIFGLVIGGSEYTGRPLVKNILSNVIDLEKINDAFISIDKEQLFALKLKRSSYFLAGTFFLSSLLNFVLAVIILKGNPGSEEFTQSLGKMTFLSFPVITIPMTVMLGFILYYLFHGLKEANLSIEDVIKN